MTNKYLQIFKINLSTVWEYRANYFFGVLSEVIQIGGVLLFWLLVFKDHTKIADYAKADIIAYYFLLTFVGYFTYLNIATKYGGETKSGAFSKYILKPTSFWKYTLAESMAEKISLIIQSGLLSFVVLFGLYYFKLLQFNSAVLLVTFLLMMAVLLMHFCFEHCLIYGTFWLDDIWAIRHLKNILLSFFGGMSFPLSMLPHVWQALANFLPFKFIYFVPVSYLLQKRSFSQLPIDLLEIFLWSLFFVLVAIVLWKKGIKRYGAYGA